MKLSLKKARKLESKIKNYEEMAADKIRTTALLRNNEESSESEFKIKKAQEDFKKELEEYMSLVELRYKIRHTISAKNNDSTINELLNSKVCLETKLTCLYRFSEEDKLSDILLIEDEKVNARDSNSRYGSKSTINIPILSEKIMTNIKESVYKIKKQIEKIEDKLAAKNLSAKISLSEDDKILLESHRLL